MKILRVRVAALATVTGLILLGAGVTTSQASAPPAHNVTLCHRTGSVAGGNTHASYSIITVDIASVANAKGVRGHDGHNQIANGPEGDIIPSYTYGSFTYPGKNLANGGAAFLENGCSTGAPQQAAVTTPTTPETSTMTTAPAEMTTPVTSSADVAGTAASTVAPAMASVEVLGAAASEANPLPGGAAAGLANTGKWLAAGLTGLTALLALGAGYVLRRRHGVV